MNFHIWLGLHKGFWTEKSIVVELNMGYMFARVLVFTTFSLSYLIISSGYKTDPDSISMYDDVSGVSCKYNSECYNADSFCIRGKCRKVFEIDPHINR